MDPVMNAVHDLAKVLLRACRAFARTRQGADALETPVVSQRGDCAA